MDDDFVITAKDLQRRGFCGPGVRRWFADMGMDFKQFLIHGMTVGEVRKIDDGMAEKVLKVIGEPRG